MWKVGRYGFCCAGLLNQLPLTGYEGSNPLPSAISKAYIMPDRLDIKKVADKPRKSFVTEIDLDSHIHDLCKFLRKQKDRNLEITINGKKVAFTSIAGMKKFAAGIEMALSIIEKYLLQYVDETKKEIVRWRSEVDYFHSLNDGLKQEIRDLKKQRAVDEQVIKLRVLAWKDRIAELEDDRQTLRTELDRLIKK